jgi:hypothetical protein
MMETAMSERKPASGLYAHIMTQADIPATMDLCRSMHAESAYSFLAFDDHKVTTMINRYLSDNAVYFACLASRRDGKKVGILAGYLGTYMFCNAKLAIDQIFFVLPEFRGSRAALVLQREFRAWAIRQGARELSIGISTGVDVERTGRFLKRLGMTEMGSNFKERLE